MFRMYGNETIHLLLWIISDVSKETREHAADDLIGKPDEDAELVSHHECRVEDQHPHRMNQLSFTVGNCLCGGITAKCLPIPIGE